MATLLLLLARPAFADSLNASAGGPYTVAAWSSVTLTAGATRSGDCTTSGLRYRWDTDNDGTYDTSTSSSASTTFSAVDYDGPTTQTVTVKVTNTECDKTSTDSDTVTITNVAPVISSTTIPATGTEGVAQTFSVAYTDVETMDTQTVAWSFSDGTTATGSSTSKTFADNGTYTATVTVTDDDGGIATASGTIVVANAAPVITSTSGTTSGNEGSAFAFACSATDVAADTVSYGWSFGDGGTSTGATATHTFVDDGAYSVVCTASDEDGGSSTSSIAVAVNNVAPTITSSSLPATGNEGGALTFSVTASDVGTADTLTYVWAFGDGTTGSGASATHTYADNGSYTVTVTVSDGDGGTATTFGTTTISNVAPTVSGISGDTTGTEGSTLSFAALYSDPGTADTATVTWDFGDGGTGTGASTSYAYASEGTYTVTVTVCDDDGACDTYSESITVSNTPAVITALATDTWGDEGSTLSFAGTATDAGGDPLTWTWDFGDGSSTTGDTVTHVWGDNGVWTVIVSVSDGTDVTSQSFVVTTNNVNPTIGGTPPTDAQDYTTYTFTPSLTDPGFDDTWAWSGNFPVGATVDSSTGTVAWTPTWADAGTWTVDLTILDDDGGSSTLTWSVTVTMLDADADGMSDTWEALYGLNPADASDAATDPDGDGLTNLEEFLAGTDPTAYDGPNAPVVWSPVDGSDVVDVAVDLVVENAVSPRGLALVYTFELYDDAGMSTLVTAADGVAEDASGYTAWTVDVPLVENTWYFWWANAADSAVFGPWSEPGSFFYNTVEEAPTAPGIQSPFDGASIASLVPDLVLDESTDPDGDVLTYTFVLTDTLGTEYSRASGISGDGLSAAWTVDITLADGGAYCWYGSATDSTGLQSPDSEIACFVVNLANLSPSAPVIVSPANGAAVTAVSTTIVLTDGVDPEGRAVEHRFELDSSPTFGSADLQTGSVVSDGSGSTSWPTGALTDNTWYYVRALCSDGSAASPWVDSSFFVNTDNDAPTVPTLFNPADGAMLTLGDALSLINSTDPDGDTITYEFAILDSGEWTIQSGVVTEDSTGTTAWNPSALADGDYSWSARATDAWGLSSEWADSRALVVGSPSDTGEPADTDTGDTSTDTSDSGTPDSADDVGDTGFAIKAGSCGCATSPTPLAGWLLVGLAGTTLARRRRS